MRLAPVSIRWFDDPQLVVERAAASSRPTHAAQRPVDACRVLAAMTAALIRGASRERVFGQGFWQHGELHPDVQAVVDGSWRGKEPPAIRGTGYCIDALEAAIWAVAGAADFRDAILRAANLGDDADTTAAIAGQLAGAAWGATGIPGGWLGKVAMRPRIESLADALHRAAVGTRLRWEHDDELHAWWVDAEGRILAGEFPSVMNDAEATRWKLDLLADAGIDTIIDLTEETEPLTRYHDQLPELAADRGVTIKRLSHPIRDMNVTTAERYDRIIADIERQLAAGRRVYIHCWGGVGRTGTVVGIWHVHQGHDPVTALELIREARAGTRKGERPSPETERQVAAIREAHARL
jgi:hypothetical protein